MAAFESTAHCVITPREQVNPSSKKTRNPKGLPKSSSASSGLDAVTEIADMLGEKWSPTISEMWRPIISKLGAKEKSFVAELATVSHDQLDYPVEDTATLPSDVDNDDIIMVDAPELGMELHVPMLVTLDTDTVMEDAPPLYPAQE